MTSRTTRFLAGFGRDRADAAAERTPGARRFAELMDRFGLPAPRADGAGRAALRQTLRIDSGLHSGATIELVAETYRIGADPGCDIVLRDPALAQRQWRLVAAPAGYALWEDEEGGAPRRLQAHAIADRAGSRESAFDLIGVRLTLLREIEPPPPGAAPTAESRRVRASRVRLASMLLAGVVVTTVAFAAVHWHEVLTRPDLPQRVVRGSQALAAQGFDAVHFREGRRGELEVAGLVAGATDHQSLKGWLAGSAYADARSTVQEAESLVEQVRQSLAGESLQVSRHGQRVLVEGNTANLAIKQRVALLAQELAGVVDIDDRVVYAEPAPAPKAPEALPVRVRDVMVGEPSYFRTDTGAYYYEGALLPDGAEVVGIEARQIRFRRDNKIIVFALE